MLTVADPPLVPFDFTRTTPDASALLSVAVPPLATFDAQSPANAGFKKNSVPWITLAVVPSNAWARIMIACFTSFTGETPSSVRSWDFVRPTGDAAPPEMLPSTV